MTTISAKTILRSRHAEASDKVLSTLLLRYPRCIHAEFMTHRVFSRNAASSRAIPVSKLIQDVMDDPYVPLHWGKNQKGMQAAEEHDALVKFRNDEVTRDVAWLRYRDTAVRAAKQFADAGYHKQIVNRLLEPFAHITVVVSGTEWSNFLALRDHPDAEPHIQVLAREVRRCLDEDPVQDLLPGQWHLPFVTENDKDGIVFDLGAGADYTDGFNTAAIKLAVARCASTSYKTVDGFDMTMEKAADLHDKLVGSAPLHASPCEHVAFADHLNKGGEAGRWSRPDLHGNFDGFCQYRKTIPNECM